MARSPTENSLAWLRANGYVPWIVEYWNAHSRKRVDMYGMFDLIGVGE